MAGTHRNRYLSGGTGRLWEKKVEFPPGDSSQGRDDQRVKGDGKDKLKHWKWGNQRQWSKGLKSVRLDRLCGGKGGRFL